MNIFLRIGNKITWEFKQLVNRFNQFQERLFKGIAIYRPEKKETPARVFDVPGSAWKGHEQIIKDIITRSGCGTDKCLEFGVEFGYSTSVFSNYFNQVTGVDIFTGDPHAGYKGDIYEKVKNDLKPFENITLVRSDYRDFIAGNEDQYDFIHVDIIHTYEATYDCGLWSAKHSACTIFHDTESFPEVKRAVIDIAKQTGKKFYNYPYFDGLGIVY